MIKCKKALNFDLDTNNLKMYYPSPQWRKAYKDIRKFLIKNGFKHRQGSGYVSLQQLNDIEVRGIVLELSKKYSWLKQCVKQFDVTDVGKQYNLLDPIFEAFDFEDPLQNQEKSIKPSLKSQVDSAEKKRNEAPDNNAYTRDIENVI